jgi:hypothetical protein
LHINSRAESVKLTANYTTANKGGFAVVLQVFRSPQWSMERLPGWATLSRTGQRAADGQLPPPSAPSRRARRAQMSRRAFIGLAVGWAGAVAAVAAAALLVRWLG